MDQVWFNNFCVAIFHGHSNFMPARSFVAEFAMFLEISADAMLHINEFIRHFYEFDLI